MKRILIINPFGLGDAIFTLRVLEGIKNSSQSVMLDFVANERTEDLVRSHRAVHEVYVFNRDRIRELRKKNLFSWVSEYRQFIEAWKSRKYDLMLDFSLGREFSFMGLLAGIPMRAGLDHKKRGFFLTHRRPFSGYVDRSVFEYQADLLSSIGLQANFPMGKLDLKVSSDAAASAQRFMREFNVDHGLRLALVPGGGRSWGSNARYKQWDPKRFSEIADRWSSETGGKIILFGDESEKALLREVSDGIVKKHACMIGYSLPEVMAALQSCQVYLGNDGGLSHLAHALGVPSAVIFGPVPEKVYAPYGQDVSMQAIHADVPCRPCYQKFHFPDCQHHRVCLDQLSVDTVYQALKKIS